jgi:hypothetical protein
VVTAEGAAATLAGAAPVRSALALASLATLAEAASVLSAGSTGLPITPVSIYWLARRAAAALATVFYFAASLAASRSVSTGLIGALAR